MGTAGEVWTDSSATLFYGILTVDIPPESFPVFVWILDAIYNTLQKRGEVGTYD